MFYVEVLPLTLPCLEFACHFARTIQVRSRFHSLLARSPRWGEGKFTKVAHEIVAISRHSEKTENLAFSFTMLG